MKLLLVRHGETRANAEGRIQGSLVDGPLSARGFADAEAAAAKLAARRVEAIYSSPLQRARQTAIVIAAAVKRPLAGTLPQLRELSWGELDGQVREGAVAEAMDDVLRRWREGDLSARAPGGESVEWVWSRASAAVEALSAEHHDESVVVVSHARVMMILVAGLVDGDLRRMDDHPIANGEVVEIEVPQANLLGRTTA